MYVTGKKTNKITRSSTKAEIARDADDIDFSVDDVQSALTLAFNSFNSIIILSFFILCGLSKY